MKRCCFSVGCEKPFVDAVTVHVEMMAPADSFQQHIKRFDNLISESKLLEAQARTELLDEGFQCGTSLHDAMLLFYWLFAM